MSGATSAVAIASKIGGGLTSAIGSYGSAKLQKTNLKAQAALAETNAKIAELGAQSALIRGQKQKAAATMQAGQLKSRQRAAMAANGIDLGEGSAAEVQASTDILKTIDMNTIEANAIRSAWGYRTQAVDMQNDALIRRAAASAISPFGSAASTLLTGSGTVADYWYQWKEVSK